MPDRTPVAALSGIARHGSLDATEPAAPFYARDAVADTEVGGFAVLARRFGPRMVGPQPRWTMEGTLNRVGGIHMRILTRA